MPNLNHLWQRFLLTGALVVGLGIGVAATVFGYSNLSTVDVHWSVFHIDRVPLWTVALVPLALALIAGTLYHWMDGLHHFTEHMRHRHRVHELEAEVASLRTHLDRVLEMPDHSGQQAKASDQPAPLPEPKEVPPEPPHVEALEPAVTVLPDPLPAPTKNHARRKSGDRRKRLTLAVEPTAAKAHANGDIAEQAAPTEPAAEA
ncbi:MAG TPA: hypothetical protein VF383_05560 [Candidatus Dormibacteraeota bacterium]